MAEGATKKGIAIGYAITGVVLFSAKAVLVKLAYGYKVDHLTLLLFRMLFSFPFYVLIASCNYKKHPEKVSFKDVLYLALFGVLGYYLASLFDFMGLQYIKAGLERIILFIYPTIVVLLSWVFFRKKLAQHQILAIIITYTGVFLTFWPEIRVSGDFAFYGGFLVFLSAVTYASYLVGSGWLIPKFGVLQFTSYAMIVSTVCVCIHYAIARDFNLFQYPSEVYYLGAVMAIFSTLIPSFLVSAAIKELSASIFSIFGSLGPVSTIVLAFFFLDEKIRPLQCIGMFIVIGGVILVSRKK